LKYFKHLTFSFQSTFSGPPYSDPLTQRLRFIFLKILELYKFIYLFTYLLTYTANQRLHKVATYVRYVLPVDKCLIIGLKPRPEVRVSVEIGCHVRDDADEIFWL